jgi:SAM-dependent methyltransferase
LHALAVTRMQVDKADATNAAETSELVKELYRIDLAFKELIDEKNEGWKSREVNAMWEDRRVLGPYHVDWRRYQKEYQTILSPHIQLFKTGNRRFLDIGCAPGGLCSMLVNLGWYGLGVSLPESLGGLQMQYCNREKLIYRELDATASDAYVIIIA